MIGVSRRKLLRQAALGTAAFVTHARESRASAQTADQISQAERNAMAAIAKAFVEDQGVPGLAVAIGHNGVVVYSEGFGTANLTTGESVTPSHLFRIASISKTITSTAIFSLIERNRLSLATRVFGNNSILGLDYGAPPYKPFVDRVTVEHLLTHTSGGWQNDSRDPMFSNPAMDQHELIAWTLNNLPLANPPGTAFAYSNFGFCVLGRVIEKITSQRYSDYVRGAVLNKCGIGDMRIAGNLLSDRASNEVVYYGQHDRGPYAMNVTRMDAHGGWLASAPDLVRFAMGVDSILRPETFAAMTTPSAVNRGYAKGWDVTGRNLWHAGSLPGTTSIMARIPGGFCWAALANSRRAEPETDRAIDRMVWNMVRAVKGWKV